MVELALRRRLTIGVHITIGKMAKDLSSHEDSPFDDNIISLAWVVPRRCHHEYPDDSTVSTVHDERKKR